MMRDNPFPDIDKEKRRSGPFSIESKIELLDSMKNIISNDRNGSFLLPLLLELVQRIENSFKSIRNLSYMAGDKFSDKTFGEYYNRIVNGEMEKVDLLLDSVLNYVRVNMTVKKTNTVHRIIEEILQKYQRQLEEKRARVMKKFEKDFPETVVPDEHIKYILNSIVRYAIVSMPGSGSLWVVTRSFALQREATGEKPPPEEVKRYIEISILYSGCKRPIEQLGKEGGLDFELKLVDEIVRKNHGTMRVELDEKGDRTSISLKFPAERRKLVFYQQVN